VTDKIGIWSDTLRSGVIITILLCFSDALDVLDSLCLTSPLMAKSPYFDDMADVAIMVDTLTVTKLNQLKHLSVFEGDYPPVNLVIALEDDLERSLFHEKGIGDGSIKAISNSAKAASDKLKKSKEQDNSVSAKLTL